MDHVAVSLQCTISIFAVVWSTEWKWSGVKLLTLQCQWE